MAEPLRHRQTKEAATDMFSLQLPRHISTLHRADRAGRFANGSGIGLLRTLGPLIAGHSGQRGCWPPGFCQSARRVSSRLVRSNGSLYRMLPIRMKATVEGTLSWD